MPLWQGVTVPNFCFGTVGNFVVVVVGLFCGAMCFGMCLDGGSLAKRVAKALIPLDVF